MAEDYRVWKAARVVTLVYSMEGAMSVDNPNGNAGMLHATDVSGNQDC
jgi:hypothetical protein